MLRRFTRWTLTVLLLGVLSLEIASVWWSIGWDRHGKSYFLSVSVSRGSLEVVQCDGAITPVPLGGFRAARNGSSWMLWQPPHFAWWKADLSWGRPSPFNLCRIPLAPFILVAGIFTGWLWVGEFRRRRKARAGCCRTCGYDLRGLAHLEKEGQPRQPPRCPECGEEEPAPPC